MVDERRYTEYSSADQGGLALLRFLWVFVDCDFA